MNFNPHIINFKNLYVLKYSIDNCNGVKKKLCLVKEKDTIYLTTEGFQNTAFHETIFFKLILIIQYLIKESVNEH